MLHLISAGLNTLSVLGFCAYACRFYAGTTTVRVLACFLMFWTVLTATAYVLSVADMLGRPWIYGSVSTALAAATAVGFRRWGGFGPPDPAPVAKAGRDRDGAGLVGSSLVWAASLGAVAAVAGTLLLVICCYPNNDDTLAYRFSRVMLYVGQGNLLPFGAFDPRLTTYPLGGVVLYLLPAVWGLGGRAFNLVAFGCWLVGGIAVLGAARELGTSRRAALIAAVLYFTAPAVLVSAASSNDDMIAGVPATLALLFALRWWRSRSVVDAGLGAIGLGLSVGTKFHILLYDLAIVVGLLAILLRPTLRHLATETARRHWRQMLFAGAVAGFFTVPGLLINRIVLGAFLPAATNPALSPFTGITNSPFSAVTAATTVAITLAQLLLGDIPGLLFFEGPAERLDFLHRFNGFFDRHLFWWLSDALNYHIPYYRFRGVAATDPGTGSWEQSVTLGLLPWLVIVTLVLGIALWRRAPAAQVAFWLSLSLLLRFVSFGAHFRYGEAAGIYGAFAIALTAPAFAWAWDVRRHLRYRAAAFVTVATGLCLASNFAIGLDSLLNNPQRNLRALALNGFTTRGQERTSPDLAATLSKVADVTIVYTHFELEMFTLMMKNMRARYALSFVPGGPGTTTLYSFPVRSEYGNVPVRLEDGRQGRLKLLGSYRGVGKELVFGTGVLPAEIAAQAGGYVVLRMVLQQDGANPALVAALSPVALVGATAGDDLEYRLVEVVSPADRPVIADWTSTRTLSTSPTGDILHQAVSTERGPVVPLPRPTERGFVEVQLRQRTEPASVWSTRIPLDRAIDIAPMLPGSPLYVPGQPIDFRAAGNAGPYLGIGWSESEAPGTWSIGDTSALDLLLSARPRGGLRLSAKVLPFLAAGHTSQTVTVLANDEPVARWTFTEAGWMVATADIPADILKQGRQLSLTFSADGIVSPAALGASADTRPLKLLFESLTLADPP